MAILVDYVQPGSRETRT